MNQVLSLVQAARTSPDPMPILHSDHMLAELLALHEDMIEQLRLERVQVVDSADFLTGMIDQHENMSAMLRTKLESSETRTTNNDGMIVITGEASSAAKKSLVTKFAQGVRGVTSVRNHMTVRH